MLGQVLAHEKSNGGPEQRLVADTLVRTVHYLTGLEGRRPRSGAGGAQRNKRERTLTTQT